MKRLSLILLVLAFVGTAGRAEMKFSLGAQAGASFSSFPKAIKDFYGTGFGGGVHGDLKVLDFLTTRLSFDYFSFASDKDKVIAAYVADNPGTQASDFSFEGANVGIFSIYADALGKIPTGSTVTPYGLVGLGLNFVSTSEGKVTYQNTPQPQANVKSSSETDFGMNFGAGVEFALSSVTLFFEGRYVLIFSENESSSHIPLMVGVNFGI
jgi:opacity protein-like surface antigen